MGYCEAKTSSSLVTPSLWYFILTMTGYFLHHQKNITVFKNEH